MRRRIIFIGIAFAVILVLLASRRGLAADVETRSLETDLVPSPAKYSVLLPDDYATSDTRYPVLFFLHGGGGDDGFLTKMAPAFKRMWRDGTAPKMVVVTPDAERSFYLDYHDGSQKWETFITTELLEAVRTEFRVSHERSETFIGGISMGGMGSLRMAFKRPDLYGAVIAFEPGIEPAFEWKDVKLEDKFWRAPALLTERYGDPIDDHYRANNPAAIVHDNPDRIRDSGLCIYLEAGSEDAFGLDRGTEFLHRVLYDNGIHHEYRYVFGADHVGNSIPGRVADGLAFLQRMRTPHEPDRQVENLHRLIQRWKRQAGLRE
jgi:S-formylglutathione hydrolase